MEEVDLVVVGAGRSRFHKAPVRIVQCAIVRLLNGPTFSRVVTNDQRQV